MGGRPRHVGTTGRKSSGYDNLHMEADMDDNNDNTNSHDHDSNKPSTSDSVHNINTIAHVRHGCITDAGRRKCLRMLGFKTYFNEHIESQEIAIPYNKIYEAHRSRLVSIGPLGDLRARKVPVGFDLFTGESKDEMQRRMSSPKLAADYRGQKLEEALLEGNRWEASTGSSVDSVVAATLTSKKKVLYKKRLGTKKE